MFVFKFEVSGLKLKELLCGPENLIFHASIESSEYREAVAGKTCPTPPFSVNYLRLAGNEGMEKKMETTTMGYIGTAIRIHFILRKPNKPKVK